MNALLRQLRRWRFRERLVRLAWGAARVVAVALAVLAAACLADWLYDRYADTPFWLRALASAAQVAFAAALAYAFVLRPWVTAPPLDDLALAAEKAHPTFGHRLVTALQLNRKGAKTEGMSPTLIAAVTREAGEMAGQHDLTKLVDYRRLGWAVACLLPAGVLWAGAYSWKPETITALLRRQALQDADIPRSIQLTNYTRRLWPAGTAATVRFKVYGEWNENMVGTLRFTPDGQPTEERELKFESKDDADGSAVFAATLEPASLPFRFSARLRDGRSRSWWAWPNVVDYEAPPGVDDVQSVQLLPTYLGLTPKGERYEQPQPRGEVVEALPGAAVRVTAAFNKPVTTAVLVPVYRGEAAKEVDGPPLAPARVKGDRKAALWQFDTTAKMIAYRIELVDDNGFASPAPARRGVQMYPDRPPEVGFYPETFRHPDPADRNGQGPDESYIFQDMPLAEDGHIQINYWTRSKLGVREANVRFRVLPKDAPPAETEADKDLPKYPWDDPSEKVFKRQRLTRVPPPAAGLPPDKQMGKFVPRLGLFEQSYRNVPQDDREKVSVEFYPLPSPDPDTEPDDMAGGGRAIFAIGGEFAVPRPNGVVGKKLIPGDRVELYVEVFDKLTGPDGKVPFGRPAGYTREARIKTVVSSDEAEKAIKAWQNAKDTTERLIKAQGQIPKFDDPDPPKSKKK